MMLTIPNVLNQADVEEMLEQLSKAEFIDGKATAGWNAKLVKNNLQLNTSDPQAAELQQKVASALANHPLFQMAVRPKTIHSLRFSRYEKDMSYGSHVDNAYMGGSQHLRTDVSFTLFLSAPETYQGGELELDDVSGGRRIKLPAGSAFVYPSSTLHEVKPVTEGERWVVVGWVTSLIRDPSEREILFEIDTVRRSLFAKDGKTDEFDLLTKTHSNLLRKWGE